MMQQKWKRHKRLILITVVLMLCYQIFRLLLDSDEYQTKELHDKSGNISRKLISGLHMLNTSVSQITYTQDDGDVKNYFDYPFLSSSEVCLMRDGEAVHTVIVVVSAIGDWRERKLTRNTWGSVKHVGRRRVETLYLVGRSNLTTDQVKLQKEIKRFGDIVQVDIMDSYRNLTLKTIMALKWVNENCSDAKFVLKTDHDAFISVSKLICSLTSLPNERQRFLYTGRIRNNTHPLRPRTKPVRPYLKTPESLYRKWTLTYNEYPGDDLPVYCAGEGYVLSNVAARRIVQQAAFIQLVHLEDVFVGICAKSCGIKASYTPNFSFIRDYYDPKLHAVGHPFNRDQLHRLWTTYQNVTAEIPCSLGDINTD